MSWERSSDEYRALVDDPGWDSMLLRKQGLVPNVVSLVGDCSDSSLVDVGTGTGWLFAHVAPREACACDIADAPALPAGIEFEKCDAHDLPYRTGRFDVVVASLLLMFCRDLDAVCAELRRVAADDGRLVVSLVHPYFYRTGIVDDEGHFVLTERLSGATTREIQIAERMQPVPYYYRPLPEYLNALIRAGWSIRHVKDWFIDMDAYRSASPDVRSNVGRTGEAPLYTFLSCEAG